MPQASNEMRAIMRQYFGGSGISDTEPYNFLRARGWTEQGGMLIKPTSAYTMSEYEWNCVAFLCDEWDYAYDPDWAASAQDFEQPSPIIIGTLDYTRIGDTITWNNEPFVAAGAVVYETITFVDDAKYSSITDSASGLTFKLTDPVNLDLSAHGSKSLKPEHIIGNLYEAINPPAEPDKAKQITEIIGILEKLRSDNINNKTLYTHLTKAVIALGDAFFYALER